MIEGLILDPDYLRVTTPCGKSIRLTPSEFGLFKLLAEATSTVPTQKLVDDLYGDDPDGGPLYANTNAKVFIHQIRKKLASSNIEIINVLGLGYTLGLKSEGARRTM